MSGSRRELAAEIAVLTIFYAALALPLLAVYLSFTIVAVELLGTGDLDAGLADLFQPRTYLFIGATTALPGIALAALAWGVRRLARSWITEKG